MTTQYRRIPTGPQIGKINYSYLQDAPAGKHGFIHVNDEGHFEFEDGTTVRFMGVNLTFSAGLCEHEMAVKIADDLAQNGCNMVRFHHVDSGHGASLIDTSQGDSQRLSEVYLDRIDFMIAQLKARGIYVHIDLNTLRPYLEGDGLSAEEVAELRQPIKSIQWYDERILELHKKTIAQYLTHENPYTGLRYVDEPAVAIVQFVNENGIFWDTGTEYPLSFYKVLEGRWNAWLLEKYGSRGDLGESWTNAEGVCALNAGEDPSLGTVEMPELGIWGERRSDWTAYYRGPASTPRMADHKAFMLETARRTGREIYAYLRELGVRCAINLSNLPNGVAELRVMADGDVTEHNNYWNHPDGGFHLPLRYHKRAMVESDPRVVERNFDRHSISHLVSGAVAKRAFVVTEWNACAPTRFRSDTILQLAAYAALQDWDGLLLFNYSETGEAALASERGIFSNFGSSADPAIWGFFGHAAAIFRQGLVATSDLSMEIAYSPEDTLLNVSDYGLLAQQAAFVGKTRATFPEEGVYGGDADLVISSGHTPTGDYQAAEHALIHTDNPWKDPALREEGREAWLQAHEEAEMRSIELMGMPAKLGSRRLLVESIPGMGVLGKSAYPALQAALEAFGLVEPGRGWQSDAIVSDTGELRFSFGAQSFEAMAPCVEIYAGAGSSALGGKLTLEHTPMTVSVLSRDGLPLEMSKDILISAMGDCWNSNERWAGNVMLERGGAPILYEDLRGSYRLETEATSVQVYALDDHGERVREMPVQAVAKGYELQLEGYMHYEVLQEGV